MHPNVVNHEAKTYWRLGRDAGTGDIAIWDKGESSPSWWHSSPHTFALVCLTRHPCQALEEIPFEPPNGYEFIVQDGRLLRKIMPGVGEAVLGWSGLRWMCAVSTVSTGWTFGDGEPEGGRYILRPVQSSADSTEREQAPKPPEPDWKALCQRVADALEKVERVCYRTSSNPTQPILQLGHEIRDLLRPERRTDSEMRRWVRIFIAPPLDLEHYRLSLRQAYQRGKAAMEKPA